MYVRYCGHLPWMFGDARHLKGPQYKIMIDVYTYLRHFISRSANQKSIKPISSILLSSIM